jgi:hypothetical protein
MLLPIQTIKVNPHELHIQSGKGQPSTLRIATTIHGIFRQVIKSATARFTTKTLVMHRSFLESATAQMTTMFPTQPLMLMKIMMPDKIPRCTGVRIEVGDGTADGISENPDPSVSSLKVEFNSIVLKSRTTI